MSQPGHKPSHTSQPGYIVDIEQLEKGLQRVGLLLTEPEFNELNAGHIISLERMELGEIGSLFILASAASPLNLGRSKQPIAFQDLPKATQDCQGCSGIPLYCWDSDFIGKRCLYLTVVDGKPAVRVCCKSPPQKALNASSSVLKS
jgi:hypothetical protein